MKKTKKKTPDLLSCVRALALILAALAAFAAWDGSGNSVSSADQDYQTASIVMAMPEDGEADGSQADMPETDGSVSEMDDTGDMDDLDDPDGLDTPEQDSTDLDTTDQSIGDPTAQEGTETTGDSSESTDAPDASVGEEQGDPGEDPETELPDAPNEGLTPDGDWTVVDDKVNGSGQEFITIETKAGNTLYLIIDRDEKLGENVYFLNQVDESDLLAMIQDAGSTSIIPTQDPDSSEQGEQGTDPSEQDPDVTETQGLPMTAIAAVIAAAAAGVVGYLVWKKKKDAAPKEKPDPDADIPYDEEEFIFPEEDPPAEDHEEEKDAGLGDDWEVDDDDDLLGSTDDPES